VTFLQYGDMFSILF